MYGTIGILLLLAVIPFLVSEAYATHYTSIGIDDIFTWREHDNEDTFDGCAFFVDPPLESPFLDTHIALKTFDESGTIDCDDGQGDTTKRSYIYMMKVLPKDMMTNGTTTTFEFKYNNQCIESTCSNIGWAVLDGAYDYTSQTEPGGFPGDVEYGTDSGGCITTAFLEWTDADGSVDYCLSKEDIPIDGSNMFGGGNLFFDGDDSLFMIRGDYSDIKGVRLGSVDISNTKWQDSTEPFVTWFFVIMSGSGVPTNHYVYLDHFKIFGTDEGTLQWDFPRTALERDTWETFGGAGQYQLNQTLNDYGFFFSYDPSVPDPPTNLFAINNPTSIFLSWEAPIFVGFNPLTGYKIERESPIGGGFTVLVTNTGDLLTTYTDTTIIEGLVYNYRVRALNSAGESLPSNESKDGVPTEGGSGDPIVDCTGELIDFELYASSIGSTTVTLCWNGEILPNPDLIGFNINFTTPWGDPLNIIVNNTLTPNSTTKKVIDLASGTKYSFRVIGWQNGTGQINNITQIVNITTTGDSFDIGDLIFDGAVNPTIFDWFFREEMLNDDDVALLIHYPDAFNATCTFDMKFARTNQTFSNISTVPSPTFVTRQMANFTFTDFNNEIVTANCIDENTNSTGRYLLYQTDFPLKQQIASFRDGTYGTMGLFGVFDFFTIGAIMFSMVGFNRIHPGVAAVFSVMILGVATYLGFIQDWSVILGGVVIAVMFLAMLVHNRNDVLN